ncbi:hypothetical protein [Leeuwenhoekiella blandensis]|uniref:Uncharacterized protein n=1 Tax=Leeuwenhoekiella blandensis (strain CECT 7118 / CCUG 51940 / KCTC 22103 / MED217) TaxID=398720 RepID=A3XRD8_LEEBM|nr:hypothetical protein [Leeuwenhoekiella blandensis]EAQ47882.1 hypothetical protein MED217_18591 [Leeuwenhoekiella blandensis MED217]
MKNNNQSLIVFLTILFSPILLFSQYNKIGNSENSKLTQPNETYSLNNTESEWDFTCECYFYPNYFDLFNYYAQIEQAQRNSWLRHQEDNLQEEIENRLNQSFSSFRDAQHAFFKKNDGLIRSQDEIRDFQLSLSSQMNVLKQDLNYTGAAFRILKLRFSDLQRVGDPPIYDFEELKYDGDKINNLNYYEVNNALGDTGEDYYPTFIPLEELYVKNYRSNIIWDQDRLANFIADQWIDIYNSIGSYESRIAFMTYSLIQDYNGQRIGAIQGPSLPLYPYSYNQDVYEHDYQAELDNWTNDSSMPSTFYNDILDPLEVKVNYAIHQMNNENVFNTITNSPAVKQVVGSHFETSDFNSASINAVKNLYQSYLNGSTSLGNFFNSYLSFSGQDSDRPEYLAQMRRYSSTPASGYYNFPKVLEQFSYEATDLSSKGNLIREFMAKGGKPLPTSLTNEMLGKLFDITGNSDYYSLEYSSFARAHIKDWDYGPYGWAWINDPFFIEGLKVVAEGGEMNWNDKIIKDSMFISTKANCVLEALISTGNNIFRKTSEAFTNGNSEYRLKFSTYNNEDDIGLARTSLPNSNGIIEIKVNLSNIANSPALEIAATILHETIHAELHRLKFSNNSGPNSMPSAQFDWYLTMWNYYEEINVDPNYVATAAEHNYMALYYIDPIALALKEFDGDHHTISHYKYLAWQGLQYYGKQNKYITNNELDQLLVLQNEVYNDDNTNLCD